MSSFKITNSIVMITNGDNLGEVQNTEFKRTIIKVFKEFRGHKRSSLRGETN